MAKAELGEKQVCPNCSAKFYDLRKRPAVCPKCETAFDPSDESLKLKRTRTRTPAYEAALEDEEDAPKRAAATDDDDEEVEETPEIDAEADTPVVALEDDEDDSGNADDLPPGFSEEEADLEDETSNEDEIPTLEDEEEFSEDEIGDLPDDDDDN